MKIRKLLPLLLISISYAVFPEKITFSADSLTGTAGDLSSSTVLTGNAYVKTSNMEISAEKIELHGDDFRFISAEGEVSGTNTESEMTFSCGKMEYDRRAKIVNLEDSVHLVDIKNSVTADAQLIEYDQNAEIAIMQIEVTLRQKDNVCTSAYAVYRKNAQKLDMSGNPQIKQGEDSFRAQEITLNLDTQEITLDGRVRGTVTDSKEKAEKSEKTETQKDETSDSEKSGESKVETGNDFTDGGNR